MATGGGHPASDWEDICTFQDKGYETRNDVLTPKVYLREFAGKPTPLIFDIGGYEMRAGWGSESKPRIQCRSLVGRPKTKAKPEPWEVLIGQDLPEFDHGRIKPKSPFEADVVTNVDPLEHLLDYSFQALGLGNSSIIDHPVVMTEGILTPDSMRQKTSELLFECYGVPSVCFGVDSLFGLHYNVSKGFAPPSNALIVSSGFETTHVLVYLDGKPRYDLCSRLSLGSNQLQQYALDRLSLTYPRHRAHLSRPRARELVELYGEVSSDSFAEGLGRLGRQEESGRSVEGAVRKVKIQLPFEEYLPKQMTEEDQKRRDQKKREQSERMKAMMAQRKEAKLQRWRETLASLQNLKDLRDSNSITHAQFLKSIRKGDFEDEVRRLLSV